VATLFSIYFPALEIAQSDMVGGCKPPLLFPACLKGLDGGTLSNLEGNVISARHNQRIVHSLHGAARRHARHLHLLKAFEIDG
jgi:hypothetical protein